MKFAPNLLLAVLICFGGQLVQCSQAQTSPAITTQATPATSAEQKQTVAQAVLQATTQAAVLTSDQEIVERDVKRQKDSKEERENAQNWLLAYAQKFPFFRMVRQSTL